MGRKPTRVRQGKLTLICDVCGENVLAGISSLDGFLTIRERRWLIYHNDCAARENVVCGSIPSPSGNRPCRINVSLIATADLLLTTLAGLAIEMRNTDWLALLQRIVWDTEFYFDAEGLNGGRRTAKQLVEANQIAYEKAGLGQQLNVKGN